MLTVKRIFRYLSGTIDIGLWYPRGTHIDLTCYSDVNFAGYKVNRKSTNISIYVIESIKIAKNNFQKFGMNLG